MRFKHYLLLVASLAFRSVSAAELSGEVVAIDGEKVVLRVNSAVLPSVGDVVEVYFKIPGIDSEASIGKGRVTAASTDQISARIDSRTGKLAVNQLVRIHSTNPIQNAKDPPGLQMTAALQPVERPLSSTFTGKLPLSHDYWNEYQRPVGKVKLDERTLRLTVPSGAVGAGRISLKSPLPGDFDIQMTIQLDPWPLDDGCIRTVILEVCSSYELKNTNLEVVGRCFGSWGSFSTSARLKGKSVAPAKTQSYDAKQSSRLMVRRRGNRLEGWYMDPTMNQWKQLSQFELELPAAVYLSIFAEVQQMGLKVPLDEKESSGETPSAVGRTAAKSLESTVTIRDVEIVR